jgi:hypothetical protein
VEEGGDFLCHWEVPWLAVPAAVFATLDNYEVVGDAGIVQFLRKAG